MATNNFLSGNNTNHIINTVYNNLSQLGIDWNFKNDLDDVTQFMHHVVQQAPKNLTLNQLNTHTIDTLTGQYYQNRPQRENISNRFEQELDSRRYGDQTGAQPVPPGLESIGIGGRSGGMQGGPGMSGGMQGGPGVGGGMQGGPGMSGGMGDGSGVGGNMVGGGLPGQSTMEQLRQMGPPPPLQTSVRRSQSQWPGTSANTNEDVQEAAEQERLRRENESFRDLTQSNQPEGNRQIAMRSRELPALPRTRSGGGRMGSGLGGGRLGGGLGSEAPAIWLSLQKDHLIDLSGNTFTFGWHAKNLQELNLPIQGPIQMRIEYMTLPKYFPYLMLRFGKERQVFTGQGRSYTAKLIPVHNSGENTTYQIIGQGFPLEELPNNLSLQLSTPEHQGLDLNLITVQRVIKQHGRIGIVTKYPHHLQPSDSLILEFPDQHACYKVAQIEIVDPYQISVDSPFSGYFSPNFRIIRDNWDLDVTICIS